MADLITINISPTPRGQGGTVTNAFGVQSIRGSFAWGGSPGQATIVFVDNEAANFCGQFIGIELGDHYFAGICKSDTTNISSRGGMREMIFVDLREFLSWDYVYCQFNMPIRRWVNGVWKKRYWHIYPADWNTATKTFTDTPLTAAQIVGALFSAPTVGSPWAWNLTGNGLFPLGLMNQPVFAFDCRNGVRLDAALNDISERGGLVYTLDPVPGAPYRLVWMRKGYGLIPVLPPFGWAPNSDDRRLGVALSDNATNIRVVGERNQYLTLNVPLAANWNRAWEQFLNPDTLFLDIFQNETDPVTQQAYTAFANDPEQWIGSNAAKVRSLQITVGEYVDMRNARSGDGDQFIDTLKFSGRCRMDMPAALYIETLVFRAYVPDIPGVVNRFGDLINLDSAVILDSMPCRVTYDPASGAMEADPTTLSDGNGLAIVQGAAFGQDLFDLVKPERVSSLFFSASNRPWGAVPFQVDDSGERQRFVIFDQPVFTSENLLTTVNGFQVLNAGATLSPATAQAALTFELEPYSYWLGTYPDVSRDRAEYVAGLFAEFVGTAGDYQEILFANGTTADEKANQIATSLLLCQYAYVSGGYRNIQKNSPLGTPLTSIIDRVDVEFSPGGFIEVVDFTTERERDSFEPERDLDRKTMGNSLFPGQAKLQAETRDFQRLGAGFKTLSRDTMNRFIEFLKGNLDGSTITTRFATPTGTLLPAGTPLFKAGVNSATNPPTNTLATWPASVSTSTDTEFVGVTTTHQQNGTGPVYAQTSGVGLALVQGPVGLNDSVGGSPNGGSDFSTNGAYLTNGGSPAVGIALQAISGATIQLIRVKLGASVPASGKIRGEYDPTQSYDVDDIVVIRYGPNAGSYGCIQPVAANTSGSQPTLPDTGNLYWLSLSGNAPGLGAWM